jgi:hypothetical protein
VSIVWAILRERIDGNTLWAYDAMNVGPVPERASTGVFLFLVTALHE